MDGEDDREPRAGGTRAVLGARLRWAEAALARQEKHLAAAREALATLERLRDRVVADLEHAEQAASADRAPGAPSDTGDRAAALRAEATELSVRIGQLRRSLGELEEAGARARAESLGLRRAEDRAGEALPFRAGPLPTGPLPTGPVPGGLFPGGTAAPGRRDPG